MYKNCGYKEECFVNGEKIWAQFGIKMCEHLGEDNTGSVCNKTGERVITYE